jgi:hypothetical protein
MRHNMAGRIQTIHLITNWYDIVHEFGWKTYIEAWKVSLRGGTFLEAVRKSTPPPLHQEIRGNHEYNECRAKNPREKRPS